MIDLAQDLPFWKGFSISSLDVQDNVVWGTITPMCMRRTADAGTDTALVMDEFALYKGHR